MGKAPLRLASQVRYILIHSHGALESETVKAEGAAAGFSWATLRRAKDELGVKARKEGIAGGWRWELPPKMLTEPEDAHTNNVSAFGKAERLRGNSDPSGVVLTEDGMEVWEP